MAKLTLKIKIDGREKNTNIPVERVKIHREINKIPSAEITFIDSKSQFKNEFVSLGTAISIEAKQGKSKLTFNGSVTGIKLKMDESLKLVIVTLKYGPANALVNKIRTEVHSNNEKGEKLKSLYQYNCSDWDFLISMADLHSRWVIVNEKASSVIKFFGEDEGKPTISNQLSKELNANVNDKSVAYYFNIGTEIDVSDIKFDKKLSSSKIAVLGVNNNSSMIEVYSDENRAGLYGDIHFGDEVTYKDIKRKEPNYNNLTRFLPKALSDAKFEMQNQESDYLPMSLRSQQYIKDKQLVKAKLFKSKYGFNQGNIKYINHGMVDTGDRYDELDKAKNEEKNNKGIVLYLGRKLFIGEAFKDYKQVGIDIGKKKEDELSHFSRITRIEHEINLNGWYTEIGWGVDHLFHNQRYPDVQYPEAFAMMPGVNGIQLATVKESNKKDGVIESSVLVSIEPDSEQAIKARILSLIPKQSNQSIFTHGSEITVFNNDDLVVLMFVNSSPDSAVVIGRLALTEQDVGAQLDESKKRAEEKKARERELKDEENKKEGNLGDGEGDESAELNVIKVNDIKLFF
ncbi:hypothetical protein HWQ46_09745 [Shewanella sp. D64]|uniref:hypothetical protein n=1 Tax=unclassified Shewanella TaxID=196818 RepID=UPI0022BA552B|nr:MULTISPECIES: hypothetical protein [unclassified Shewanella]MEC4725825.1 hypothetical protein [Shewanella sp. D64]MEC4737568.1 hypothetical protein [Shewanella sp. E94]WBJ93386.1 hypothetical protein HWQ47_15740 [Shewanella sp. MTB7]